MDGGLRETMKSKILVVLLVFLLSGCTATADGWVRLDADDFYDDVVNVEGAFILDVRTQSEWENDGHLSDATLIPNGDIEERSDELPADKDTTILVYCRSGNRSQEAAQTLVDLGYTDVRELKTGITGWKNAGYSVV